MSKKIIGIRREDKNRWERRVPFTPEDMQQLQQSYDCEFLVQTSPTRIFPDEEFSRRGITVAEDISAADIVFAVKEIPKELIAPGKVYIFFSHTVKGQAYNMPLLQKVLDTKVTLIDYERIVDEYNRRLVFFGAHAGYAGMIDSLHLLGQRHAAQGHQCKFGQVKMSYQYDSLTEAREEIAKVGELIKTVGFPEQKHPLVFGFAGYGNVSLGAQSILDILPTEEIPPEELIDFYRSGEFDHNKIYKCIFKEEHLVERKDGGEFDLQRYYNHPEEFESRFSQYLPALTVLINAIYWTEQYPRLITKAQLKQGYSDGSLRTLEVIGDISIDIDGAIECTYKATEPDMPAYVYEPLTDTFHDGVAGDGPVVLAVDNLPCEISREASESFSFALKPFIGEILDTDWEQPFKDLVAPLPIKKAIIAHQGKLTPDYEYIQEYL